MGHQNHHVTDENVCPREGSEGRAGVGGTQACLSLSSCPLESPAPRLSAKGKQGAVCVTQPSGTRVGLWPGRGQLPSGVCGERASAWNGAP